MEPPVNANESDNRDDSLIDAARREVLGDSGSSEPGRGSVGDAPAGEPVATPHSSDLHMLHYKRSTHAGTAESPDTQTAAPTVKRIPKRIGHYHVRRAIASGGMGTVYEATQEHPRRTVAIKVMRHGITSPRALRRFEYESQILARLHHPGIAHVYEADWHEEDGERLPYFAMEYIPNAKPLLRYADDKHLPARARLELFIDVCQAVHHGHQRGVIHRDLKPGNILVDPEGQVKIIDFGVARCTDADLNLTALQTSVGEMVGTLKYMSPEQCEADPHDLDIRSDIYSLGVLLFELLSGRLPYDLYSAPIISAPRVICEEPPTRLSSINRSLRGDIETIVAKALEKDRQRRYQSTLALGEDIEHYLNDEPILARPPSAVYRLRKLVRRRRVPLGAAAAVFVMALIVVATQGQAWAERQERHRLEAEALMAEAAVQLSDFRSDFFDRNRVLQACSDVLEVAPGDAKAYAVRGRVRYLNGAYKLAAVDCDKALKIDPENILALRTCAFVHHKNLRFDTARRMYEQALSAYKFTIDLPRDFHNRAHLRRCDGEYRVAMQDHDRAVALAPDYGLAWKGRGVTRYMIGDVDGAIDDLERAASLPRGETGDRALQCYLWIWEMRRLRDAPGDREAAAEAFKKAEVAAQDRPVTDPGRPVTEGLVAVLRGERAPDDYLGSLEASDKVRGSYYIGAKALVDDRKEDAAKYFKIASEREPREVNDEPDLAEWHLRRLREK